MNGWIIGSMVGGGMAGWALGSSTTEVVVGLLGIFVVSVCSNMNGRTS